MSVHDPQQGMTRLRLLSRAGLSLLLLLGACSRENLDDSRQVQPHPIAAPTPDPGFAIAADGTGVLFTWVDKDGSFKITEEMTEIPDHAQKTVRVVVEKRSPGNAEYVFVVDLSTRKKGEEIPVRSLSRSAWELIGGAEREKRIAALRPQEEAPGPSPADLGVDAIVYGADWCKPCHLAEDYLKKKGARVVKKDIEEDPAARVEMKGKLKKAGMSGSSIPVLDIGGTILRGFSRRAVDAALKRAHKAQ